MPIGKKDTGKSQLGSVMKEVQKILGLEKSMFVLVEGVAKLLKRTVTKPILQRGNKEETKESSVKGGIID